MLLTGRLQRQLGNTLLDFEACGLVILLIFAISRFSSAILDHHNNVAK